MRRTDATLMKSAAAGDKEAFAELAARHLPRIISFALGIVGDCGDAEDVAQDTLIEAFRCAERFDGRPTVVPWLLGIAANRCLPGQQAALGHIRDLRRSISCCRALRHPVCLAPRL